MLAARFLASCRTPTAIFHPPQRIHASFAVSPGAMRLRAKGDGKKEKKAPEAKPDKAAKAEKGKEADKAAAKPGEAKKEAGKPAEGDKKKGAAPAAGDKTAEGAKPKAEEEEEEEEVFEEKKKKKENLGLNWYNDGEYVPDIVAFRKANPNPLTRADKRMKKYRSAWNPKRKKKGLESFFKDGTSVLPPNGVYPEWMRFLLTYKKTQLSDLTIRDKMYWKLKRRAAIKAANGAKAKEA